MINSRLIFSMFLTLIPFICFGADGNFVTKGQCPASDEPQNIEQKMASQLAVKLDSLAAVFKGLDSYPIFGKDSLGKVKLSRKEKMVKPDYLIDPAMSVEFTTLQQKYYGLAVLLCDAQVAKLYDMPLDGYKEYIAKLALSANIDKIQDPFDINKINGGMDSRQATLYWSYSAAFCVESVYIITRNIEKFMAYFDDKSAAQFSKRLNVVEDAIYAMMPYDPAMRSLNQILEPLYIIKARNVAQLTDQLYQLQSQISVIRDRMLE